MRPIPTKIGKTFVTAEGRNGLFPFSGCHVEMIENFHGILPLGGCETVITLFQSFMQLSYRAYQSSSANSFDLNCLAALSQGSSWTGCC